MDARDDTVEVEVAFPEALLERIDAVVAEEGYDSRSAFVRAALAGQAPEGVAEELVDALAIGEGEGTVELRIDGQGVDTEGTGERLN